MNREAFEELVLRALRALPPRFRKRLDNVEVVVKERPSQKIMAECGVESPGVLLGLYRGIPLRERGAWYGNVLPDQIIIFQRPLESMYPTKGELERRIREVLMHEIGHHFGLGEEEMEDAREET
ncbi:MAG: metallopeptidase family protein [candidate division NC10 bacterium]|nr:metallopeptidase family protein [candidate division NC10 bacterium]